MRMPPLFLALTALFQACNSPEKNKPHRDDVVFISDSMNGGKPNLDGLHSFGQLLEDRPLMYCNEDELRVQIEGRAYLTCPFNPLNPFQSCTTYFGIQILDSYEGDKIWRGCKPKNLFDRSVPREVWKKAIEKTSAEPKK